MLELFQLLLKKRDLASESGDMRLLGRDGLRRASREGGVLILQIDVFFP